MSSSDEQEENWARKARLKQSKGVAEKESYLNEYVESLQEEKPHPAQVEEGFLTKRFALHCSAAIISFFVIAGLVIAIESEEAPIAKKTKRIYEPITMDYDFTIATESNNVETTTTATATATATATTKTTIATTTTNTITPEPDLTKILLVSGSTCDPHHWHSRTAEVIDLSDPKAKTQLGLKNYPLSIDGATGDLMANGIPLICGGQELFEPYKMIGDCYSIGKNYQQEPFGSLSVPRKHASSLLWNVNDTDVLWITGGEANGSVALASTEFVSTQSMPAMASHPGPELPLAIGRHCMVKVSDSIAILTGGDRMSTVMPGPDVLMETYFFTKTNRDGMGNWTSGPRLPCQKYYHACGLIKDSVTTKQKVVVAAGAECAHTTSFLNLDNNPTTNSLQWTPGPYLPALMLIGPTGITTQDMGQFILVGGFTKFENLFGHNAFYSLSCANSDCHWTIMDQTLAISRYYGVAMLVPSDFRLNLTLTKILVATGSVGKRTELIDLADDASNSMRVEDYPLHVHYAVGGLFSGDMPVFCGGEAQIYQSNQNNDVYDCYTPGHNQSLATTLKPRSYSASVMWTHNGTEVLWITGGINGINAPTKEHDNSNTMLSTEYVSIDSNVGTKFGPNMPFPLRKHCMIKVDETTVIFTGGDHGWTISPEPTTNSVMMDTLLYTTDHNGTHNWTTGPRLLSEKVGHVCAIIKERSNCDMIAIVAGGEWLPSYLPETNIFVVNPNGHSEVKYGPNLPSTLLSASGITSQDGKEFLVVGGNTWIGTANFAIYSLSCDLLQCEWRTLDQQLSGARSGGVAFLVPENYQHIQQEFESQFIYS